MFYEFMYCCGVFVGLMPALVMLKGWLLMESKDSKGIFVHLTGALGLIGVIVYSSYGRQMMLDNTFLEFYQGATATVCSGSFVVSAYCLMSLVVDLLVPIPDSPDLTKLIQSFARLNNLESFPEEPVKPIETGNPYQHFGD